MRLAALFCVGLWLGLTALAGPAFAKRVALVIGNDAYENVPKLEKAVNDARAVADALRSLDFEVLEGTNLDRRSFNNKLNEFEEALKPGDVAAFFYAGHGVEISGANYLIPSDIPHYGPGEERLLAKDSVGFQDVLEMLQTRGTQVNIVILDASRSNPFAAASGSNPAGGSAAPPSEPAPSPSPQAEQKVIARDGDRGLSLVEVPTGTFILYSAGAHQNALDSLSNDDPSPNSVFTRHLLPLLAVPDLDIAALAKRVQVAVLDATKRAGRAQEPSYYDNTIGRFSLKQTGEGESLPAEGEQLEGENLYRECTKQNEHECYRDFLTRFPNHGRAAQVYLIIQEQIEVPLYRECADATERSEGLINCKRYLSRFPGGSFVDDVRERIERIVANPGKPPADLDKEDKKAEAARVNQEPSAKAVANSEEAQVEQAIAEKEAEVEAKVVEKAAPGGLSADERAQIEKDRAELAGLRERLAALEQQKATPVAPEPGPVAAPKPAFDPGKRIALVIGNSAYNHVPLLKNPASDAKAVADSFRKLGFAEVIEKHDLSLNQLSAELQSFGDRAFDADWAVIYFAGHGVEVDRANYLIPVDAELKAAAHVDFQAVPLERATGAVGGARQLRLVILDACRDNPFAKQMAMRGGTRSVGRGLARVEPQDGVLVAYAAEDGQVALDGDGANSPFASALVQHLQEPGLEVGLLFRRIATTVRKQTGDRQVPFTYGSLTDAEFYFNAAK